MGRRTGIVLAFALAILALDQGTKSWARRALLGQPGITVIEKYFDLRYHENTGMAFGLGRDLPAGRFLLIGVGLGVLFIVWRIVRHIERRRLLADIGFGLVAGGAIGNMVDRVQMGRVVDFIVMHWQYKYTWPAYNIADAALCVGVGLLVIALGAKQEAEQTSRSKGTKVQRRSRS